MNAFRPGPDGTAEALFARPPRPSTSPGASLLANDRRLAGAPLPAPKRLLNWYLGKFQVAARRDAEVAMAF